MTGGLTVEWDGERKTIPQLQPHLQSTDRAERERAFRLGAGAYLEKRDELAGLFDRMYELRQRAARNAGFENFEQYVFKALEIFRRGKPGQEYFEVGLARAKSEIVYACMTVDHKPVPDRFCDKCRTFVFPLPTLVGDMCSDCKTMLLVA